MINSIEIKNFKAIKKKYFQLGNLNVLMGLNGMGKSSFIQTLLLLRQSDNLRRGELKLNGFLTNIGTTKDALYQYDKEQCLQFSVVYATDKTLDLQFDFIPEADVFLLKDHATKASEYLSDSDFFKESLFGNDFQYLNANRLEPSSIQDKSYTNVVTLRTIGNKGEYTSHFIEVHGNEDVLFDNLIHPKSTTRDSITEDVIVVKTLINQVNLWMGEISPGINIRTTAIPNSEKMLLEYVYIQPNLGNTNRYKPANVGFGISYALPVVTALLASRPGEILIIENPEAHIHPKGQAALGKLISLVALNDVQVFIETHSDHVLNGIRVGVKEQPALKERTVAFYFERKIESSEQFSKITTIYIDERGELSEYPKDLLDEWSNQLIKLV
jgi:predicted ATPase